jgi:hypothetical protein
MDSRGEIILQIIDYQIVVKNKKFRFNFQDM